MKWGILLVLLWLVALAGSASALPTANSVITPQTPKEADLQLLATASCTGNGTPAACCTGAGTGCTAGTYYTLYSAGSNGSKCNALWMDNNDGSAQHLVTLQINNGTTKVGGVAIQTVSSAGFANGTPPQNILTPGVWIGPPKDSDGNQYIQLNSGETLTATFATAITATDYIDLHIQCADF